MEINPYSLYRWIYLSKHVILLLIYFSFSSALNFPFSLKKKEGKNEGMEGGREEERKGSSEHFYFSWRGVEGDHPVFASLCLRILLIQSHLCVLFVLEHNVSLKPHWSSPSSVRRSKRWHWIWLHVWESWKRHTPRSTSPGIVWQSSSWIPDLWAEPGTSPLNAIVFVTSSEMLRSLKERVSCGLLRQMHFQQNVG